MKKFDYKISRREFIGKTTKITLGAGLVSLVGEDLFAEGSDMESKKKSSGLKIIALAGSPRKGGNTDTLVSEMLRAAEAEGAATEKIYLIDQNIKPCIMCNHCRSEGRPPCKLDDDFNGIVEKIILADALVLATPVYWGNASGMIKIFMERGYSLFDSTWSNSKIAGKSGALVVCFGGGDVETQTNPVFFCLDMFFGYSGVKTTGRITAMADAKGEVAGNKDAIQQAVDIGKKLAFGD